MAYIARFAQPSVWAKLPPDAKDIPVYNSNNEITGYKSIVQATTSALTKIKGGAVASFIDTDVEMMEATSDGKVIFDSYDHEDRQIAKGILLQTLTTEEAKHMARAASSTHQDVFGILLQFLRDILEWSERNEILKPLVLYNFGEEASKRFVPIVSYGEVQVQDIPAYMGALAQLALAGGVHSSMWADIRDMLGLPSADAEAEAKDLELSQKAKELAANPPEPALVPRGNNQIDRQTGPGQANDPQSAKRGTNSTAPSRGVNNNANPSQNPPAPNPTRRANANG
jgi:phage gp29-like protein